MWFCNYESRKGKELGGNPHAAMNFWWGPLERSIRIDGRVEKIPAADSDMYFAKRPRQAQIGAWASLQSSPVADQA